MSESNTNTTSFQLYLATNPYQVRIKNFSWGRAPVQYFNPYPADLFFPLLRYMPNSTKVNLKHFIHTLLSVTNVQGTKVLQIFLFLHTFLI